jgi:hypothetical protein
MGYVALLFAVFAVVVSIVALVVVINDRKALRRALSMSSLSTTTTSNGESLLMSSSGSLGRSGWRSRPVVAYGFAIGPVGESGLLVTSTGGVALGVGCNNGPNSIVEPPSSAAVALDQNAISVTRGGKLCNLYATMTATTSNETAPVVARVSVWTAPCGSDTFSETSLLVRKTDVDLDPTISCLANVIESVPVGAGDRVAILVRVENADGGALVTALSVGFELHAD